LLNSITVTPAQPNVALGLTAQLTATGNYTDGSSANITSQVHWSSSAPGVATVSNSGLVSTLAVGTSTLSASLNGSSRSTTLTVNPASLQSIAVTASESSFALGLSLQLKAEGTYSDGSMQDLTSSVTWSSQSPAVGVVSSTGLATGHTTGSFNAQATVGQVSGILNVTVSNAVLQSITVTPADRTIVNVLGNSIQYTATGNFSDGTTANLTNSVHWAITSGIGVGSISSSGRLTPLAVGTGVVTATSGTISGSTGFLVVAI
jgi:hypothetical protein